MSNKTFLTYSFVNIESSSGDDVEEDEYIRDGTDYGNITRIQEGLQDMILSSKPEDKPNRGTEPVDVNVTIVSDPGDGSSISTWAAGIMALVEDSAADSDLVDVSFFKLLSDKTNKSLAKKVDTNKITK